METGQKEFKLAFVTANSIDSGVLMYFNLGIQELGSFVCLTGWQ